MDSLHFEMFETHMQGWTLPFTTSAAPTGDSHKHSHNVEQLGYTNLGSTDSSIAASHFDRCTSSQDQISQAASPEMASNLDSASIFMPHNSECWSYCSDTTGNTSTRTSMSHERKFDDNDIVKIASNDCITGNHWTPEHALDSTLADDELWLAHFVSDSGQKSLDSTLKDEDDWSYLPPDESSSQLIKHECDEMLLGLCQIGHDINQHQRCASEHQLKQQSLATSSSFCDSNATIHDIDVGLLSIQPPAATSSEPVHKSDVCNFSLDCSAQPTSSFGSTAPYTEVFSIAEGFGCEAYNHSIGGNDSDVQMGIGVGTEAFHTLAPVFYKQSGPMNHDCSFPHDSSHLMLPHPYPSGSDAVRIAPLASNLFETQSTPHIRGGYTQEVHSRPVHNHSHIACNSQIRNSGMGRDRSKDDELISLRRAGRQYSDIKRICGFQEAESTLRGRYRMLTKSKEARVRKPAWTEADVTILKQTVNQYLQATSGGSLARTTYSHRHGAQAQSHVLNRIPWKQIAESMANRGCYHYGNATVKKKYLEVIGLKQNISNV